MGAIPARDHEQALKIIYKAVLLGKGRVSARPGIGAGEKRCAHVLRPIGLL